MSEKLRIGIIGLGGIAHLAHLNSFSRLKECEIAAGCDVDESKFEMARPYAEKFYSSHREMLDDAELDAVVVGTPNCSHVDISIDALNAGVHVLCEKPVARSAAEAMELQRVEEQGKARLMIGQSVRFRPQTSIIMDLIKGGKLGEVYYCQASYLRKRGIPGFGTWFTDKSRAGGGVVLDLGVHMIDYIWYLLGRPGFKSVSACVYGGIGKRIAAGEKAGFEKSSYPSTYRGPEKNIFDVDEMCSAFLRFAGGVAMQLELSWAMNVPGDETTGGCIYGDRGAVTLNPIRFMHDGPGRLEEEEIKFEPRSSHDVLAEQFIRYIRGDIPNPAPLGDAVEVMRVLDALYESAEKNKEISL